MKCLIRNMCLQDYNSVRLLWDSTPGMGLNDYDDSENGICRFLGRNPGTCFVAVHGATLAGVILAGHDGRRGHIYHMAVAERFRGGGIGAELVTTVLSALESEGIQKVSLVAFARNEAGNSFWEHMGFTLREDLVYWDKVLGRPG